MTTKKGAGRARRAGAARAGAAERRRKHELREVLDDLVAYVRQLSHRAGSLTPDELAYAEQRLEWLADELWRLVMESAEGGSEGR